MSIDVRPADRADTPLVDAFARLIPQLSSSSPAPDADALQAIIDSPDTDLLIARDADGTVVGSLTLAFYRIPTGLKAWIEDVVVDETARGRGVGAALNEVAVARAIERGAKNVSLTSRPAREIANRLYQRLGFDLYPTNVYRRVL